MNRRLEKVVKILGFLWAGCWWVLEADNTTPSPRRPSGVCEASFGPPPTRPTHQTEKANLPNGNTTMGVTKQSYCRVSEPIFPTGTKAPKGIAATLHAAATKGESRRFMGTIKQRSRCSPLSMNLLPTHPPLTPPRRGTIRRAPAHREAGGPLPSWEGQGVGLKK